MQLMSRNSVPAAYPAAAAACFLIFRCCVQTPCFPLHSTSFFLPCPRFIPLSTLHVQLRFYAAAVTPSMYPPRCILAHVSMRHFLSLSAPHVSANLFLMFHACMPARRQLLLLTKYKPVCAKLTAQDTSRSSCCVTAVQGKLQTLAAELWR